MMISTTVMFLVMATSPTPAAACSVAVQANLLCHPSLLLQALLLLLMVLSLPPPLSLVKDWGLNPEVWLPLGKWVHIPGLY
jgi:hypothetical protein